MRKDRIDALALAGTVDEEPGVSLIRSAWKRLRRNPVFLIGATITIAFIVLAIIAPWIAPWDVTARPLLDKVRPQTNPVPGPEAGHLLGGDDRGRDLLSRLLVGSRQTLIVGVFATLFGLLGGLTLGTVAGRGRRLDRLAGHAHRRRDALDPVAAAGLHDRLARRAAPASGRSSWRSPSSRCRSSPGSCAARCSPSARSDHVLAARSLGVRPRAIVFRHMLPNSLGPVIVQATLSLAVAIIDAAALSFLGLGNPDQRQPEWGQMLGLAQQYISEAPHLAFYPAGCIIVVALGFTLMGESLREALDPKSRR